MLLPIYPNAPIGAMDLAALIAKQMKAVLHIVYVVDDQVSSTSALACQENANQGTHMIIKEGGPVTVLQAQAVKRKAEGAHGKPWLVEAILGSTAYELLTYPPCDVLVTPLR